MSAASKRRKNSRPVQDSLRPGWMLNAVLFCVLLAGIGACYVWLGVKHKGREEQLLEMHREISSIQKRIKEADQHISRRLTPEDLRARSERAGLQLKPIDIGPKGRLYRLPDPMPQSASPSSLESNTFAGPAHP